jgi:hypothetical protein
MKQLTSTEFARSPGVHLESAARGERILLMRYGRPYVMLSPPPPPAEAEETPAEQAQ